MIQVWQFDTREKSKHESSPTPILLPEFLHPHSLPSHSCLVAIDEECYPQRLMQACLRLRGDWRRCPVETERCVKASERTLSVHVKIKLILRTNLFFTMFSDTHAWPGCVTPCMKASSLEEMSGVGDWRREREKWEMRGEKRRDHFWVLFTEELEQRSSKAHSRRTVFSVIGLLLLSDLAQIPQINSTIRRSTRETEGKVYQIVR